MNIPKLGDISCNIVIGQFVLDFSLLTNINFIIKIKTPSFKKCEMCEIKWNVNVMSVFHDIARWSLSYYLRLTTLQKSRTFESQRPKLTWVRKLCPVRTHQTLPGFKPATPGNIFSSVIFSHRLWVTSFHLKNLHSARSFKYPASS